MAHPACPVVRIVQNGRGAVKSSRRDMAHRPPTCGHSPPSGHRLKPDDGRKPTQMLQGAPQVLPDLMSQSLRLTLGQHRVHDEIKARRTLTAQRDGIAVFYKMPTRRHRRPLAIKTGRTKAPTACVLTAVIVHQGRELLEGRRVKSIGHTPSQTTQHTRRATTDIALQGCTSGRVFMRRISLHDRPRC